MLIYSKYTFKVIHIPKPRNLANTIDNTVTVTDTVCAWLQHKLKQPVHNVYVAGVTPQWNKLNEALKNNLTTLLAHHVTPGLHVFNTDTYCNVVIANTSILIFLRCEYV